MSNDKGTITKGERDQRISEIKELILTGHTRAEVIRVVTFKACAKTIDNYLKVVYEQIEQECQENYEVAKRAWLAEVDRAADMAREAKDTKAYLQALELKAKAKGIFSPIVNINKIELDDKRAKEAPSGTLLGIVKNKKQG